MGIIHTAGERLTNWVAGVKPSIKDNPDGYRSTRLHRNNFCIFTCWMGSARFFITPFQQVSGFHRDVNISSIRRAEGLADKTARASHSAVMWSGRLATSTMEEVSGRTQGSESCSRKFIPAALDFTINPLLIRFCIQESGEIYTRGWRKVLPKYGAVQLSQFSNWTSMK